MLILLEIETTESMGRHADRRAVTRSLTTGKQTW
jgi:hypothetical protein